VRGARRAALWVAALAGGSALLTASVAVVGATYGVTAPTVGVTSAAGVGSYLLAALKVLAGSSAGAAPGGEVWRAVGWAVLAGVAGLVVMASNALESKFMTGEYPPMRNLDKS